MIYELWVRFAVENSIVVIVLALIAEGVSRWAKNVRIANLLWMVVLAKFMVPSFLFCELPLLPPKQPVGRPVVAMDSHEVNSNAKTAEAMTPRHVELPLVSDNNYPDTDRTEFKEIMASIEDLYHSTSRPFSYSWLSVVGMVWLCGSLVWFAIFALRLRQFQQGLRASYRADDSFQSVANHIALQFRLAHPPEIRVIEQAMSPMLWSCSRNAQIVLPNNMLDTTSNEGLTAVLAHEIAHLKRGDYWVQRVAMMVLGVFWWHPVSWFAVKRLRQTQDACCDIDVVAWKPELRVAFAKTLVEVAAMVRSSAPPFALAFLDPYTLRTRVQTILQETNHARLGFLKSFVIVTVGIGLASVSARLVAQTPVQQGAIQTKAPPTQSPNNNPAISNAPGSLSRSEIEVLEPDGSIAANAKYVVGKRHDRFRLDDSLEAVSDFSPNKPLKTFNVEGGTVSLPFDPTDEFVAVWSEKGFFQIAISRLVTATSIQLQEWVTLQLDLRTKDGPDEGASVSVSNYWTSDGQYSAMQFSNEKVIADKNGKAIVTRVAPGGVVIRTNVKRIQLGNTSWEEQERTKTIRTQSQAIQEVSFGGSGGRIRGTVSFPKDSDSGDFDWLKAEIDCKQAHESVHVAIENDGSFECEDVPFGDCEIRIRTLPNIHFGGPNVIGGIKFYGSKVFDCTPTGKKYQSIGIIELKRTGQKTPSALPVQSIPLNDDFRSTKMVAVVATTKRERTHYTLLDNEGQMLRSLEHIEVPVGWGSNGQFVAFDLNRNRLYLLSAYDETSRVQTLHTLDLTGKRLMSRELAGSSCRIAVDAETGDLWILNVQSIGRSKVELIDQKGNLTKTYSLEAFTLCYSTVDKAFWLVGSHGVNKVDAATGESIASYRLPAGIWTLSNVLPDPEGGIVAVEQWAPDLPKSANRIWRFDSNAIRVGCIDVGNAMVKSVALVDGEIWVSGIRTDGLLLGNTKFESAFLGFDRNLEPYKDRELGFTSLGAEADGKYVWAIHDKKLQKVIKDKDGRIHATTGSAFPIEGAIWASGN